MRCFIWLPLFLFVALSPAARAEGRPVGICSWKGTGSVQTARFRVTGRDWTIRHSHVGGGFFQVAVYDEKGTLLDVPVNLDRPGQGRAAVTGSGVRWLAVTAEGGWTLAVEQAMTAVEELALRRELRGGAAVKPAPKRAEWGCGAGTFRHVFKLPAGHWRLVCQTLGGGRAEFLARAAGTAGPVLAVVCGAKAAAEGWFHGGGVLDVAVAADTAWRFEIYGEPAPEMTRTEERKNGTTEESNHGQADESKSGRVEGPNHGQADESKSGQADGQADGRVDGRAGGTAGGQKPEEKT